MNLNHDLSKKSNLTAMPDVHYIAIPDDVFLALESQCAARACFGFRPSLQ